MRRCRERRCPLDIELLDVAEQLASVELVHRVRLHLRACQGCCAKFARLCAAVGESDEWITREEAKADVYDRRLADDEWAGQ